MHTLASRLKHRRALSRKLALALAPFAAASSLQAQATWVGDSSNDWNTAANWSSDPSNPSGNFTVNGAGLTPVLSSNSAFTPVDVIVGVGATGRFDHTGGTLSTGTGNWFIVGRNASGNGTYNLADTSGSGGSLTSFGLGTGSLNVGGSSTTSGRLIIADTSSSVGVVNMNTTGTLKLEDDAIGLLMGNGGTSNGTFKLDAGTLQINSVATAIGILVGTNGGDANFSMSGGTVNTTGGVWVGDNNVGSQGTLTVSGGSFNVTASSTVGSSANGQVFIGRGLGQGTFTVSGTAAVTVTGATNVGFSNTGTAGTVGTLTVSGGTFTNTGEMRVGSAQNGNGVTARADGTFNVSGGTANIGGALVLARGNDNGDLVTGSSTVSGGTLNVENDLIVAYAGNNNLGQMTISGGTVNVATTTERWMMVNQWDTSRGQLTVSGGTLNLNANTDLRFSAGNGTGASSVTLSSGAITSYSGNGTGSSTSGVVDLMQANVTGNNTFNLDGGTLTISQVITNQDAGTAVLNLNGGLLKASNSTGAVITGNTTVGNFIDLGGASQRANVRNGGAKIDTNGFNVTVKEALQHSNIGGDNATDGGLIKSGAGTLTLSGVNTYTGNTTISAGTLALASTGSIANSATIIVNATFDVSAVSGFAIGASQTLQGSGTVIGNTTVNGTLAPGNSPGLLTFNNNLTLGGASTSQFEINGTTRGTTFDAVNVGGTLTYGGAVSLFFNAPITAGTYDLFGGSSGGSPASVAGDFATLSIAGTFAESLTSGPVFSTGTGWTASSANWTYVFNNASGDLTISAVPEPSAFAALAGLAGLGFVGARRRRRRS